jgi:hypothetical protein
MKPQLINLNHAELKYASGWKLTLHKDEPLSMLLFLEAIAADVSNKKLIEKITNDTENNTVVVSLRCIKETATDILTYINDNLPTS